MITPIDPNVEKQPDSRALIGCGNVLVSTSPASAGKVLTKNTYEMYSPDTDETEVVLLQANSISPVNYVAVIFPSILKKSANRIVTVRLYDDVSGGALLATKAIDMTKDVTIFSFDETYDVGEVSVSFDATEINFAYVQAGELLKMQQPIYGGHSPIELSSKTKYESAKSVSGNFIGRTIESEGGETSFSWRNLTSEWYRSEFQPFVEHAKTEPFFIQWRPDYHPEEVSYCWTTKDIKPVNQGGSTTLMSVSMTTECFVSGI